MAPTGLVKAAQSSRLSGFDDEQVVALARAGSANATEYLLKKYRGFVESKARSYFLAGAEPDDVVQEGMIGLYKAIRDYQSGRFVQFRSFAELCVTRQIITAVKSAIRNKHVPLNDYLSFQQTLSDEDSGCVMDVMADPKATDPEKVLIDKLAMQYLQRNASQDLSDLESDVLEGYLDGESYSLLASGIHRPVKTIDNALQRAKRKVGRLLCELN